jgi:uncharacterized membrane protein
MKHARLTATSSNAVRVGSGILSIEIGLNNDVLVGMTKNVNHEKHLTSYGICDRILEIMEKNMTSEKEQLNVVRNKEILTAEEQYEKWIEKTNNGYIESEKKLWVAGSRYFL